MSEEASEGKRKVRKIMICKSEGKILKVRTCPPSAHDHHDYQHKGTWSIEAGGQTDRSARYANILHEYGGLTLIVKTFQSDLLQMHFKKKLFFTTTQI